MLLLISNGLLLLRGKQSSCGASREDPPTGIRIPRFLPIHIAFFPMV
jgi:hypothetical protein